MLQLKLAMFAQLPYPGKMIPGVFVTCADDILIFDSAVCDFTSPGFTALAHRSPLVTAAGHGVFALPGEGVAMGPADAFIHKPSESRMREKGLVRTTEHPDGSTEEWAYTDSAFFFDRGVSKKLLTFWDDGLGGNLGCEIDCYGDFLQPLGPAADDSYLAKTTSNIVAGAGGDDSELVRIRKALWELLRGTALSVMPLHPSRFYHIGTFAEYLHFFARDKTFGLEVVTQTEINVKRRGGGEPVPEAGAEAADVPPPTILLNCDAAASSIVGVGSVVEFSVLGANAIVGCDCLLSGADLAAGSRVPDGTFLQTWALTDGTSSDVVEYVAHVIATTDDIKKVLTEGGTIQWLGCSVADACATLGVSLDAVWVEPSKPKNLWEARLFPIGATAAEATSRAVAMLAAVRGDADAAGDLSWLKEGGAQLQSLSVSLGLSSAEVQTKLRSQMSRELAQL